MTELSGRRFVKPAEVETQVFDWGTIKWLSEPRVTKTQRFSMGVVLLHAGKGHARHNHPGSDFTPTMRPPIFLVDATIACANCSKSGMPPQCNSERACNLAVAHAFTQP